jgi:hypothetical protein
VRLASREGVRCDFGFRAGEFSQQSALAGIRPAEDDKLSCTLPRKLIGSDLLRGRFLGRQFGPRAAFLYCGVALTAIDEK